MNSEDANIQKMLKVLKHQEIELSCIGDIIYTTNNQLNNSIASSENLLKDLGDKLNSYVPISVKTPDKVKKPLLRNWDEIVNEAEKDITYHISFIDLLSEDEVKASIKKIDFLRDEFDELNDANCDNYDYLIGATCGTIGGLIDVFFVGLPSSSVLGKAVDSKADKMVEKFADLLGWDKDKAIERGSNTTKSAIGFLENGGQIKDGTFKKLLAGLGLIDENGRFKGFKINYDHRHGGDVDQLFRMSAKNHHLKSLAHSPSIIGLFFSLLNQFTSTSSFVSNGKIFTINTETFELHGSDFKSKVFAGFVNWIGHIFSDIAGASGSVGRGAGIPIPFYELFQFCNFGSFGQHRQTFSTIAVQVFEQGYDFRHGATMAVPVVITELLVRIMWTLKSHYYHNKSWKESIPLGNNPNLRRMLFIAHGSFCLIDLADAAIRSGGVALNMLLRMNLVAWVRFGTLGFEELKSLLAKESMRHKYVMGKINEEWIVLEANLNETIKLMNLNAI